MLARRHADSGFHVRCELKIGTPSADLPITRGYDVLLRLDFDFAIMRDGVAQFSEVLFPAVELAYQLRHWTRTACASGPPFVFDSSDDDRPGLVWFRPSATSKGRWEVGSCGMGSAALVSVSWDDLRALVARFIENVISSVRDRFSFDAAPLVEGSLSLAATVRFGAI